MSSSSLEEFALRLKSACEDAARLSIPVVVASHISPDPDAISSAFSLAALARAIGAPAQVFLPDPLPLKYAALVGTIEYSTGTLPSHGGVLVGVDTATRKRLGETLDTGFEQFGLTFNLDHHISNPGWASVNHIDGAAAASALLVYRVYEALQIPMSPLVANLLYAGILDDTGSFCFANVNASALSTAAELVARGATPEAIATALYFSVPERILRLQALALQRLELRLGGRVSLLVVDRPTLESTGCTSEDTEGLIDFARKVEGVSVAVFLRELDGKWKASLRSKTGGVDVNQVAGKFGGGGHAAAAGATLTGSLFEVEKRILDELQAALCEKA